MKVLCEISGGADSALAALIAQERYPDAEFHGLFVDYGQAPGEREWLLAKTFCDNHNIILKRIIIRGLFTTGTIIGEQERDNEGVAGIYTPLRNVVLLACSSSYAEGIGANRIITGSKGLSVDSDPYSFKDSTLPFYKMFEGMLHYISYLEMNVTPILAEGRNNKMTKAEVFRELLKRGVHWDETNSCFNKEECGKCNNCLEKDTLKKQWQES